MTGKAAFVLVAFVVFSLGDNSLFAQQAKSTANGNREQLAKECIASMKLTHDDSGPSCEKLLDILQTEVENELTSEAQSGGMDEAAYISSDEAFTKLTKYLKALEPDSMAETDLLVALFKSTIRYDMHRATGKGPNYKSNVKEGNIILLALLDIFTGEKQD
jgi:hypothetical protein